MVSILEFSSHRALFSSLSLIAPHLVGKMIQLNHPMPLFLIKYFLWPAEAEKYKANDGAQLSEPREVKLLSLSDILHRAEANSEASHDGPRSEREDSDEELDLGFETSISGDEDHDGEPNVLHGSLNLRIHRKDDSARENGGSNGSCESNSSPSQERTKYQVTLFNTYKHIHTCVYNKSYAFSLLMCRCILIDETSNPATLE